MARPPLGRPFSWSMWQEASGHVVVCHRRYRNRRRRIRRRIGVAASSVIHPPSDRWSAVSNRPCPRSLPAPSIDRAAADVVDAGLAGQVAAAALPSPKGIALAPTAGSDRMRPRSPVAAHHRADAVEQAASRRSRRRRSPRRCRGTSRRARIGSAAAIGWAPARKPGWRSTTLSCGSHRPVVPSGTGAGAGLARGCGRRRTTRRACCRESPAARGGSRRCPARSRARGCARRRA